LNNLLSSANSELYHANSSATGDNVTAYSPLGQLTGFSRGTLSVSSAHNNGTTGLDTVSSPGKTQAFSLDPLGNWASSTTNGTTTSRTTNSKNEVTAFGTATLTFDHNGNTLTDQSGQTYIFDAWNRPVTVKNAGNSTIATDAYDANGRRINESGVDVYFSAAGQELEDRGDISVCSVSEYVTISQYVWSPTSVNDLVLRDDNPGGNLDGATSIRRVFAQQDANDNVTALTSTSAGVLERFIYDLYGVKTDLSSSWASTTDSYNWSYLFQGGKKDGNTGQYRFGARDYSPTLGRWLEQDPAGGIDGANWYQMEVSNPASMTDPFGTTATTQSTSGTSTQATTQPPPQKDPIKPIDDVQLPTGGRPVDPLFNAKFIAKPGWGKTNYDDTTGNVHTDLYKLSVDKGASPACKAAVDAFNAAALAHEQAAQDWFAQHYQTYGTGFWQSAHDARYADTAQYERDELFKMYNLLRAAYEAANPPAPGADDPTLTQIDSKIARYSPLWPAPPHPSQSSQPSQPTTQPAN